MKARPDHPTSQGQQGLLDELLETWRPLFSLGAQLIYFGAPILRLFWSDDRLGELAARLEGREEEEKTS
jgi:hypothetical protein